MSSVRCLLIFLLVIPALVQGRELGHYAPGIANIRDLAVPAAPGFYYLQYNAYFTTDTYRNSEGDRVDSLPGPLELGLDTDVDLLSVSPAFYWSTEYTILGGNYAFYIVPTLATTALGTKLYGLENSFESDTDSAGLGDTYVQPLSLGWHNPRYDISLGLGVYLPTGKYDADENDNIGLGFFTGQAQLSGYYYLDETQASALMLAVTFETHTEKEDTDVTAGNQVTLEYGFSQYLSDRLEVGIAGYSQWQVERDTRPEGAFGLDPSAKEEVHALGLQIGYWATPRFNVAFKYMKELDAKARFQGDWFAINFTYTPFAMFE